MLSSESIDLQIVGEATSPQNAFGGTPERPEVKNLYRTIYKALKVDPEQEALAATADHFQYSPVEMRAILNGDLGLLRRTQDSAVKYNDLLQLQVSMVDRYNDELAMTQLHSQLIADTYAQEIFVNGDTGDSGFDVVYDLELIEYLVFGDEELSSSSASGNQNVNLPAIPEGDSSGDSIAASSPSAPAPSPGLSPSPLPVPSPAPAPSSSPSGVPVPPAPPVPSAPSANGTPSAGEPESSSLPSPTPSSPVPSSGPLNPAACVADPSFQNVFEEIFPPTPDSPLTPPPTSSGPTEPISSAPEIPESPGTPRAPQQPTPPSNDPYQPPFIERDSDGKPRVISSLKPEAAADWQEAPKLCNKIFCIKVRFVNRPDPQYEATQNCIQCHVQHIVKVLREAASVGLTPGKVSGNFMEPGLCKKSLFNSGVSLNFIPVAMPILTPSSSKLISGTDLAENFSDFAADAWGVDFSRNTNPDTVDPSRATPTLRKTLDQAISQQQQNAAPGTSQSEAYEDALTAYMAKHNELENKFRNSRLRAQFGVATDFYEAMGYELDQMRFYFGGFRGSLDLIQQAVNERKNTLEPAS